MALNFLQLNAKKTKVVIIGQSSSKNQIELPLNRVFPNIKQVVRILGDNINNNCILQNSKINLLSNYRAFILLLSLKKCVF